MALAIGIFCLYSVLARLLQDFVRPATIRCALTLAAGGALTTQRLTHPSFPMAIVVIGGLITSTVLSLLVVPVVFIDVDDLLQWGRSLWVRRGKA